MADNNVNNNTGKPSAPIWKPWGAGGYLWRNVVFLLGMLLIILFLALLLNKCNHEPETPNPEFENVDPNELDDDPYRNLPPELLDSTTIVDDWNDSIVGVPELPDPYENLIPPVDSTSFVPDPDDSLSIIVGDQLIVLFNSQDLKADMASFAKQFKQLYPGNQYQILYYNPQAGTMLLGVPADELKAVGQNVSDKITNIDYVITTNQVMNELYGPKDPGFGIPKYSDNYSLIQAYDAWDITRGSADVKVAIVDSYFDLSNPEIGERYVDPISIATKTRRVLPPTRAPRDVDELGLFCHGTHVAGLAIGGQNNKGGCSGIAPNCTWIPIALENQSTSFNILEGIMYAIYHGADVVNLSYGAQFPEGAKNIPLADQVAVVQQTNLSGAMLWEYVAKISDSHNCVICTSAGNETILMGLDSKNRSNNIIKVENVDSKGIAAASSNFGRVPEADMDFSTVAAPGENMWSAAVGNSIPYWEALNQELKKRQLAPINVSKAEQMVEMSGTSMASPVVTGAVALLKSKNKNLTNSQVINILKMTAKQTDTQNRIGPTIQIKDALDRVGDGELLNFDDLMKNHDLLLGVWKSTHEINLVNSNTNEVLDEMWTYFIFEDTNSGVIEMHTINTKKIYRANLSVSWGKNSINIVQLSDAVSADGDKVNKDDFVCRPNAQRLLEASCQRNGKERYNFMLEKVK